MYKRQLLSIDERIEKHLVLSATTKQKDAADIVRKFSGCRPDKILFTKVDETSAVGLIVELLLQHLSLIHIWMIRMNDGFLSQDEIDALLKGDNTACLLYTSRCV